MLTYLKKHWLKTLLLLLLFWVIGACAPFYLPKSVSPENLETYRLTTDSPSTLCTDRAILLETNTSALAERIRLINQAQTRIILSTFDIRLGESASDLAALLLHKADEGVQIQILTDGFNTTLHMEGHAFFYALSSHPNIEIRQYNPLNPLLPWTTQGRMHDKYVIVDDLAYILGGRNTFDYFLGDYETADMSYDREVLVYNTSPGQAGQETSLTELEDYFDSVWNLDVCKPFHNDEKLAEKEDVQAERALLEERYEQLTSQSPELFTDYDYVSASHPVNSVTLLRGEIGIYGKEPLVLYQLSQLMNQAQERVIIHTPYAVCNSYMYQVLEEVAKTVPDVTLMINSIENGDNVCASSDYLYNKKNLVRTGIPIYEYDGGLSYHGKSIVIDDHISIIGSYNFDMRSTYVDTELMLVIDSQSFTEELTGYMETYQADCRKVLDAKTYEVPEHVTVTPLSGKKKAIMHVLGIVEQFFRFLV
ncbi:MAG: phospholipase D family protein [Eubacteriales bacterium]|nr:phospholipase D family protein [Eubacteriales bacterium]